MSHAGYNAWLTGSNPTLRTSVSALSVALEPNPSDASSNVQLRLTRDAWSNEPNTLVAIGASNGRGRVVAYLPQLGLGLSCQPDDAIVLDASSGLLVRPSAQLASDLGVSGTLSAARYANLVPSFAFTNPFVPPSASALRLTYETLSNMIVAATGRSNLAELLGSNGNGSIPSAPFFDAAGLGSNVAVDFAALNCVALTVVEGGYVNAASFCNLVDDYVNVATRMLPPSSFALHQAYCELSNAAYGLYASADGFAWWATPAAASSGAASNAAIAAAPLARLDSNGVFWPSGGYGALPVPGMTSDPLSGSSNLAASAALVKAVADRAAASSTVSFLKASSACNIVLDALAAARAASNVAYQPRNLNVLDVLTLRSSADPGVFAALTISSNAPTAAYPVTATIALGAGAQLACPAFVGLVQDVQSSSSSSSNLPPSAAALAVVASCASATSNAASALDRRLGAAAPEWASNVAAWASNAGAYGSNAGAFASNVAVGADATAAFGSNAASFGSENGDSV